MSRVFHDQVRELTTLLRFSDDHFWCRLRALLSEKGVSPSRAVIARCFPDDNSFMFGIVIRCNGSVFQFGFDYLNKPISKGVFTEWEDLSGRFRLSPHCSSIEAALKIVDEEQAG